MSLSSSEMNVPSSAMISVSSNQFKRGGSDTYTPRRGVIIESKPKTINIIDSDSSDSNDTDYVEKKSKVVKKDKIYAKNRKTSFIKEDFSS